MGAFKVVGEGTSSIVEAIVVGMSFIWIVRSWPCCRDDDRADAHSSITRLTACGVAYKTRGTNAMPLMHDALSMENIYGKS